MYAFGFSIKIGNVSKGWVTHLSYARLSAGKELGMRHGRHIGIFHYAAAVDKEREKKAEICQRNMQ